MHAMAVGGIDGRSLNSPEGHRWSRTQRTPPSSKDHMGGVPYGETCCIENGRTV